MIHYTCDLCKKPLSPEDSLRYVVKIEVTPTSLLETDDFPQDLSDEDSLVELHELLEAQRTQAAEFLDEPAEPSAFKFDLCECCHKRFVKNPLGRDVHLEFSRN